MKKIKSIKQLRAQKEHINHRLGELEHTMQRQWADLKQGLKPSGIIRDSIGAILRKQAEPDFTNGNLLRSALTYGAGILVGKLADKAREKFSRSVKREDSKLLKG